MTALQAASVDYLLDVERVGRYAREYPFAPGDTLRQKGHFYSFMFVLTEGEVEILVGGGRPNEQPIVAGRGAPVGEISFLTGRPATATVRARTPCRALGIDDTTLRDIEKNDPAFLTELYRHLADIGEGRESFNLNFFPKELVEEPPTKIVIRLARDPERILAAQRLRYEVYCVELGRVSPYADHDRRVIADDLDSFGHVFVAYDGEEAIGTLRSNAGWQGDLGILEDLYGMKFSPHHPRYTSVTTKFIVRKTNRQTQTSFHLMRTAIEYAEHERCRESYIDCIPSLLLFYKALGFEECGPAFLHRENGRSLPLKLDIEKYGKRIKKLVGVATG